MCLYVQSILSRPSGTRRELEGKSASTVIHSRIGVGISVTQAAQLDGAANAVSPAMGASGSSAAAFASPSASTAGRGNATAALFASPTPSSGIPPLMSPMAALSYLTTHADDPKAADLVRNQLIRLMQVRNCYGLCERRSVCVRDCLWGG